MRSPCSERLTVTCPNGTVVLGGGGKYGVRQGLIAAAQAPDYQVIDSYPEGTTGWTAVFYQKAVAHRGYRAEVYAVCAKLT